MIHLTPHIYLVGSGSAGFDLTSPLDCHVYLIDGISGWALIDTGAGADTHLIVENIARTGVDTSLTGALFLTHGHADHAGGTAELLDIFPSLTAYAHEQVATWLARGDELGISLDRGKAQGVYPQEYTLATCDSIIPLAEGETISFGESLVTSIDAPGHCHGHMCFLADVDGGALFSGDSIFHGGRISLQNLHDANIQHYAATAKHLSRLRFAGLFPGHHNVSIHSGESHVQLAREYFARGTVPPSI